MERRITGACHKAHHSRVGYECEPPTRVVRKVRKVRKVRGPYARARRSFGRGFRVSGGVASVVIDEVAVAGEVGAGEGAGEGEGGLGLIPATIKTPRSAGSHGPGTEPGGSLVTFAIARSFQGSRVVVPRRKPGFEDCLTEVREREAPQ